MSVSGISLKRTTYSIIINHRKMQINLIGLSPVIWCMFTQDLEYDA